MRTGSHRKSGPSGAICPAASARTRKQRKAPSRKSRSTPRGRSGASRRIGRCWFTRGQRFGFVPFRRLVLSGDHGLTDDQIRLVKALRGRTAQADELIEETGIPARRALSALTVLELDEIVTQDAGKQFSLAVTLK